MPRPGRWELPVGIQPPARATPVRAGLLPAVAATPVPG
jgi:hypothetical protein